VPDDDPEEADAYRPVLPPEVHDTLRREWLAALEATAGPEEVPPGPDSAR
jgi:hypothetical protein